MSLGRKSTDLLSVLMNGTLWIEGQSWSLLPREVVSNAIGVESVIFEACLPGERGKPGALRCCAQAIRFQTLTLSLLPILAVLFEGWVYRGQQPSWAVFALVVAGALFLQIAGNLFNDVEDHLRLVDRPGMVGGSGVIQKGWVSAGELRQWGWGAFAIGVLLGLAVWSWGLFQSSANDPLLLVGLGSLGALGVLLYSNGPYALKYRALGDLAVFFMTGPLLVAGAAQVIFSHAVAPLGTRLVLGLFVGWMSWACFQAKHLRTFEVDKKSQNKTGPVQMGYKNSRHVLPLLYGLAYLSLALGVVVQALPMGCLVAAGLGLPIVLQLVYRVYLASGPASALLEDLRSRSFRVHFWLGSLTLVGFFLKF